MARLIKRTASHSHRILVIDDDEILLKSTLRLLRREGHETLGASTPEEGIEQVRLWKPHLLLLDYFMPRMTGDEVVAQIRKFDKMLQVLLVTGYAGETPARELMATLDIQGYHDKSDGPTRLLMLCDSALKHYRALSRLNRQRLCLHRLASAYATITRLQPLEGFYKDALDTLNQVLKGDDAGDTRGIFATRFPGEPTGFFEVGFGAEDYHCDAIKARLVAAMGVQTEIHFKEGLLLVPLSVRDEAAGCVALEIDEISHEAIGICEHYAQQISMALENLRLFKRATHDQLTGLFNRSHGEQRLTEVLAHGARHKHSTGLIFLDIDHFKVLNDTRGHAAGDVVLREVAAELRRQCRTSDIPVRFGGEEFVVILPETGLRGTGEMAERLRAAIAALEVPFDSGVLDVRISAGGAASGPAQFGVNALIRRADKAMYTAKAEGRDRISLAVQD